MAFSGTQHKRSKIVTGSELSEKVSSFNFVGCETAYLKNRDKKGKLNSNACV
jgi:hypothetical protein